MSALPQQSETVTTRWTCDECGRTGAVTLDSHAGVFEGFNAIEDSHREAAQDGMRVCPGRTRDLRVTLEETA